MGCLINTTGRARIWSDMGAGIGVIKVGDTGFTDASQRGLSTVAPSKMPFAATQNPTKFSRRSNVKTSPIRNHERCYSVLSREQLGISFGPGPSSDVSVTGLL